MDGTRLSRDALRHLVLDLPETPFPIKGYRDGRIIGVVADTKLEGDELLATVYVEDEEILNNVHKGYIQPDNMIRAGFLKEMEGLGSDRKRNLKGAIRDFGRRLGLPRPRDS